MNKMVLNQLVIQGVAYKRTINFNKDLTIISGEKTSGKSLVLSLIDYCLGKSNKIDFNVQKELSQKCDQAFLEFKIKDEIITFNRALKQKHKNINIYFCAIDSLDEYIPKVVSISEAMGILMHKLGIDEYKLIRHQKHSKKKEIDTVSFRDIFRYVYVHQHELGTADFLSKKSTFKANKNPHAFKMIFNLVDKNKDDLKEQLVNVQNSIEEIRREFYGLNSYLKDLEADNRIELQAKSEKIFKEIEENKILKSKLLEESLNKSNNDEENKMYIKLKNSITEITNQIFDYQNEKRQYELSISSKKLLIREYMEELKDIEATLEVNYKITIPEQSLDCPLCNSKIKTPSEINTLNNNLSEKALKNIQKQVNDKLNLVKKLIEKEKLIVDEIEKNIEHLLNSRLILNNALKEYAKKIEVPFLSQLNSINVIINGLYKNYENIKESLRIHNKLDEKDQLIKSLEISEKRLIGELERLEINRVEKTEIFDYLDSEYKTYMERLKYDTSNETYIHREKYIPFYNGASVYSHESGGLLECMQLSYLGAILKSKSQGYATGHPGILVLDSLSKYVGTLKKEDIKGKINDPEVYEEFFEILVELSKENQIILVENTPPSKYDEKYVKYTFYKGDRGLIDEEENEIELDLIN